LRAGARFVLIEMWGRVLGKGSWWVLWFFKKGTAEMLKTRTVRKPSFGGVRGVVIGAGLACSGWLAPAVVASPAILDWLPTDASIVIASKPLVDVEARVQALGAAIQAPVPIPTLAAALAGAGITDGIDTSKPVGVAMYAAFGDDGESPEFTAVQVVGTTDYAVLVGNFGVQPGGAIDEVVANGETMFIKRAGEGYAALSTDRATLERFTLRAGNKGEHEARMGAAGRRMASEADMVVLVDVGPMREPLKAAVREGAQRAAAQAAMFGGEAASMDSMLWLSDVVLNDAQTVIATANMSATGVVAELGVRFTEGSRMAGVFARPAAGGSGLDRLPAPDQGYFLAFTADTSNAGVKGLIREFTEQGGADGGMQGVMLPSIDKVDGISMVVGASPSALFGGGLLINTVTALRSSDPAGLRASLEEQYKGMDGMEVGGATMTSTFTRNSTEVNGKAVDEWSTRMRSTDPMLAQTMMMMYGPSGPGGYLGRTESGVVLTMSRNSQLLGRGMEAIEGRGSTLGQMDSTRRVMGGMPEGRISEALIGVQGILDTVRPMLGMIGAGQNIQLPSNVPPVAMSTSAGDGTARLTLSVPAEVLQAGVKLGGAFGGGMAPGGAPGGQGTGQPMF